MCNIIYKSTPKNAVAFVDGIKTLLEFCKEKLFSNVKRKFENYFDCCGMNSIKIISYKIKHSHYT